jgi:hypothetical protein
VLTRPTLEQCAPPLERVGADLAAPADSDPTTARADPPYALAAAALRPPDSPEPAIAIYKGEAFAPDAGVAVFKSGFKVSVGSGRIVVLCSRSSSLYQIHG